MEDFCIARIIVGIFYQTRFRDAEEVIALNPSIPKYLLTKDFSDKALFLLVVKGQIVAHRWRKFFDTCYKKMFISHKTYLTIAIFACIRENACNHNVFESFVSVSVLLNYICFQTLQKTGVNLYYLNLLTMMAFYSYVLQDTISRNGGGKRLMEFIRDHRYHNYESEEFPEPATSLGEPVTDLQKEIKKEILRDGVMVEEFDVDEAEHDEFSIHMAKLVLQGCVGVYEHPILPRKEDVVKSVVEFRKKERARIKLFESAEKSAGSNVHWEKSSNSITESKTNQATKNKDNIEQYESIIQAVIRHNLSKSSGHESANNKIPEEADVVLQHLEETIEKLNKVLTNLTD